MTKNKIFTFKDDLKKRLKNPEFKKAWDESETEYQLARQIIEKRLAKQFSQRDLAKNVKTSQAAISRLESMNSNPSLSFLKKVAFALGKKVVVSFK
jgi:ribosome-binding protein aMBF1 (putative translation factor)